ncbi:hypothetical protein FB107DRAFT_279741 [Schizophyllum commune]
MPFTALRALWGCLHALTLNLVLASALPALKARARGPTLPLPPPPIERVPRTERPPFEYSPHREFTVVVLGAGCVVQRSEICTASAGFGSWDGRAARIEARMGTIAQGPGLLLAVVVASASAGSRSSSPALCLPSPPCALPNVVPHARAAPAPDASRAPPAASARPTTSAPRSRAFPRPLVVLSLAVRRALCRARPRVEPRQMPRCAERAARSAAAALAVELHVPANAGHARALVGCADVAGTSVVAQIRRVRSLAAQPVGKNRTGPDSAAVRATRPAQARVLLRQTTSRLAGACC